MSEHQHRAVVILEDGVKAAEEYGVNRKAHVELTSDCFNEGELAARVEYLAQLANQQVSRLLGRSPAIETTAPAADKPAATRTRRTKEQIAADEAAAAAAKAPPASDEISFGDEPAPQSSTGGSGEAAASPADDISFDVDPVVEVKPITDVELNNAVQQKNGELKDPPKIKGLIAQYRTDPNQPFSLTQIPADKRQDFLDKLDALK